MKWDEFFNFLPILFFIVYSLMGILILKNKFKIEKDLSLKEKFKTIFITLYFGIFIILFPWIALFNLTLAILIFLHLVLIILITNIKKKRNFSIFPLLFVTILGIYMCICNLLSIKINTIIYYILFLGIYIIPGLSFYDNRKNIIHKIKTCTEEVDAKVIKVIKGYNQTYHMKKVYIPLLEINYNGKKYTYMDSNIVYSYNENEVRNINKAFINPNFLNTNNILDSDNILIPSPNFEDFEEKRNGVILFYVSTLIIFIIVIILNIFF